MVVQFITNYSDCSKLVEEFLLTGVAISYSGGGFDMSHEARSPQSSVNCLDDENPRTNAVNALDSTD